MAQWLRHQHYDRRRVFSVNSLIALRDAAAYGMGLTVLPCYLGDAERRLARVGEPVPGLAADLWLPSHPDLRRTERIRVFADALRDGLAGLQPMLDGHRDPS